LSVFCGRKNRPYHVLVFGVIVGLKVTTVLKKILEIFYLGGVAIQERAIQREKQTNV
jgi:hypothetical protein